MYIYIYIIVQNKNLCIVSLNLKNDFMNEEGDDFSKRKIISIVTSEAISILNAKVTEQLQVGALTSNLIRSMGGNIYVIY